MRIKLIIGGIILFLIFTNNICQKSPVEPEEIQKINLRLESILCTEVYLSLKVSDLDLPIELKIYSNDSLVSTVKELRAKDTVLIIDKLLPKRAYEIYVKGTKDGIEYYKSNLIRFMTLDTTSRNFTWQVFEFGDIGISGLHDVAIIDENNIWAVGEIRYADSSKNRYTTYNAIHWDGQKWELKRILYKDGIWDIRTIFVSSANDIWFSGYVRFYNGKFIELSIPNILIGWKINKLLGSSSEDLYAVGDFGNIAHWDGKKWTKIESGVDVNLIDIHGQTTDGRIYICGYNIINEYKATVLEMKDKNVRVKWYKTNVLTYEPPYGGTVHNLFTFGDYLVTVGSSGFYIENTRLGTYPRKVLDYQADWVYAMRGNDVNDIFTFSDQNEIYHFNGVNLRKVYGNSAIPHAFYGGNVKGDIVVGVGVVYVEPVFAKALLVIGRRN
jgi:hypothetical protein